MKKENLIARAQKLEKSEKSIWGDCAEDAAPRVERAAASIIKAICGIDEMTLSCVKRALEMAGEIIKQENEQEIIS